MPTLHMMVGLPCSGKTALAKQLEDRYSALRLTPDEWQMRLFGSDVLEPEHDARHNAIESMMWDIAARVLALGVDVILDFGFWSRTEREDFRARAARLGAGSEVHFLDVSEEELLKRLADRNAGSPEGTPYIPEAMFRSWFPLFEPPAPDELERRE